MKRVFWLRILKGFLVEEYFQMHAQKREESMVLIEYKPSMTKTKENPSNHFPHLLHQPLLLPHPPMPLKPYKNPIIYHPIPSYFSSLLPFFVPFSAPMLPNRATMVEDTDRVKKMTRPIALSILPPPTPFDIPKSCSFCCPFGASKWVQFSASVSLNNSFFFLVGKWTPFYTQKEILLSNFSPSPPFLCVYI